MDGLQADQTWLLLALQPLVLSSHERLEVYVQFDDSSCLLGICCALCQLCSTILIDLSHTSP